MRWLQRDLREQINSIKRELENLESIWILASKLDNKRKLFYIDNKFPLIDEFREIFIKTYDPIWPIKEYLWGKLGVDFALINSSLTTRITPNPSNILDIFMIWDIDRDDFSAFLSKTFFNKKIKYAIITTIDFYNRIEYNDKLIYNILTQEWNIFVRDDIQALEKMWIK